MKPQEHTLYSLIILILMILLGLSYFAQKPPLSRVVTIIDTLTIFDTIVAEKTIIKARGVIKYDTIKEYITTKPFIASLDTIDPINQDTLSIQYAFPVNTFLYALNRKPQIEKTKIIHRTDSVFIPEIQHIETNWFYATLKSAGLVLLGYGIGRIR